MTTLPALSADEMAAVDRAMFTECGLDVLQVMEVAGRAVAVWVRQEVFGGDCSDRRIAVLCGTGGNGGDALVAARYLFGWGALPILVASAIPEESSPAGHQLMVDRLLRIPEGDPDWHRTGSFDLVIDGLLGFGGRGRPRGATADLIEGSSKIDAPVIAIDIPSGLDATSGEVHTPCVSASATVTLGLPKTGLLTSAGRKAAGRIVVADIGIPDAAYRAAAIDVPAFRWQSDFVELP